MFERRTKCLTIYLRLIKKFNNTRRCTVIFPVIPYHYWAVCGEVVSVQENYIESETAIKFHLYIVWPLRMGKTNVKSVQSLDGVYQNFWKCCITHCPSKVEMFFFNHFRLFYWNVCFARVISLVVDWREWWLYVNVSKTNRPRHKKLHMRKRPVFMEYSHFCPQSLQTFVRVGTAEGSNIST